MIVHKLIRTTNQLSLHKLFFYRNAGQYQRAFQLINSPNSTDVRNHLLNLGKQSQNLGDDDLEKLRTDLITNKKFVTKVNVDYFIVSAFDTVDGLNFVEKYIEFLRKSNLEVNKSTLGRLLRLYNAAHRNEKLSPHRIENILHIYRDFSAEDSSFDATTCENLILGLICTDEWKKCLDLLAINKLSAQPSNTVYSSIISKAFEVEENHEIGWQLLKEMVHDYRKQPKCEIYISLFEWIQKETESRKREASLSRMLSFIAEYDIIVSQAVIDELKRTLDSMHLESNDTQITFNGKCQCCKLFLERIFVSNDDFKRLRAAFLDRVLVRKDVFVKSNPNELQKYLKFIDKYAPFHCVIDGLNVAYSMGGKQSSDIVCSVIRYFKDMNMNTLIIGRKHMNRWPQEHMSYIKKNSALFLTDDLSQDDPFLLYAALRSGPSTHIFSRDLMRSHSYLLGAELRPIFKKWLQEHLYSLVTVNRNGKIIVREPSKYNSYAHRVDQFWHIPYRDMYQANPKDSYDLPKNWLCFRLPITENRK